MRYDHVELLAPAGSMDSLKAALFFGANAVYAGGPFLQLRAGQTAFDLSAIAQAADLCHERGARLYIAANAFTFPEEIEKMKKDAEVFLTDVFRTMEMDVEQKKICCHWVLHLTRLQDLLMYLFYLK